MILRFLAAEVTLKTRSISAGVMYPMEEMRVGGERRRRRNLFGQHPAAGTQCSGRGYRNLEDLKLLPRTQ
jgi:hypothetical protein